MDSQSSVAVIVLVLCVLMGILAGLGIFSF